MGRVPWFMELGNVRALASHLVEQGQLGTVEELIYFLNKPWKWSDDYRKMTKPTRSAES